MITPHLNLKSVVIYLYIDRILIKALLAVVPLKVTRE